MTAIMLIAIVLTTAACAQKTAPPAAEAPAKAPPAAAAATTTAPTTTAPATDVASPEVLAEIAMTRTGIQARRQALVTAAMDLTAEESAGFWPLYRDYRTDMARVDDRLVDLILVYAANYDALSDDMAANLLDNYIDVERARLDVKSRYVPRFQRVLPSRKVARFFQLDNKFEKTIEAELAAAIPLTR
jgi:hypothetical protein